MQRRKFSREFKLEAVKLVRDRGVTFPGHGQMRPEQLEIERLTPCPSNRQQLILTCRYDPATAQLVKA